MNKKYIKPQTDIIEMEAQPMMAASLEIKETEVHDQLSKEHGPMPGFDLWGDDEE